MTDKPKVGVKVLTRKCAEVVPDEDCKAVAMVQVVTQEDPERQKQIDELAYEKLNTTLAEEHKEGKHL
jgi:hypothetical protein